MIEEILKQAEGKTIKSVSIINQNTINRIIISIDTTDEHLFEIEINGGNIELLHHDFNLSYD